MTEPAPEAHADDAQRALAALVGRPLTGSAREENALYLDFGTHFLQVLCAWRLTIGGRLVAGSGDLYTPADPDADLEEFDWQEAGATWWDVRMRAFHAERDAAPPAVRSVHADALLGLRVELDDGGLFEAFPHSSEAAHVVTEHWRLVADAPGAPTYVATTGGLEVEGAPGA